MIDRVGVESKRQCWLLVMRYTSDTRSWVLVKPFVFSLVLWVSVLQMLNIEDKFSSDSVTLGFQ